MITLSRETRNLLAGLSVAFLGALIMAAPAQAQYGLDDDDDDWGPRRARTVVIEKSIVCRPPIEAAETIEDEEPVFRRPAVERTVIIKQPIVRPVVHKTVVVERPVVQRVVHRTVIKQPIYIDRVVRRPVYVRRTAFIDRGWYERPRCYLPERHLCR